MWLGSGWDGLGETEGMPVFTVHQVYDESVCNQQDYLTGWLFGFGLGLCGDCRDAGFHSCCSCGKSHINSQGIYTGCTTTVIKSKVYCVHALYGTNA